VNPMPAPTPEELRKLFRHSTRDEEFYQANPRPERRRGGSSISTPLGIIAILYLALKVLAHLHASNVDWRALFFR